MTSVDPVAFVKSYFDKIRCLLDSIDVEAVARMMTLLEMARVEGRQVFIIGNGGSASTASHWACDLNKGAAHPGRRRLRVISLTDNMAHFSAIANDYGYDRVFTEQLRNLVQEGDVLIGISASGNSPNLVHAFDYAGRHGATTVAVVGFSGGKIAAMADHVVHVQSGEYGPVEDLHLMFDHVVTDWFRTVVMPHAGVEIGADGED